MRPIGMFLISGFSSLVVPSTTVLMMVHSICIALLVRIRTSTMGLGLFGRWSRGSGGATASPDIGLK